MKPIIAFDMDGTIIDSSASAKAHESWFSIMGTLLKDDSLNKLAGKEDYFPDVLKAMERLTGLDPKDSFEKSVMVKYARNLYQMLYLAELRKEGKDAFVPDMLDMIVDMKPNCRLALITTAPEDMVLPALEIVGLKKMFDYVYRSPLNQEPSKVDMLRKFIKDVGKPALYIGNENKDAEACKELGVKFALAKWGKHDEEAGKMATYNLSSPKQLRGVLELL
ncbi:HAD hydrolase-like protein [Candidatus Woesearchaeota archaeon]|nr:HAD hydrolase-like protein [Candidatus Woesearchaeota archaeon]